MSFRLPVCAALLTLLLAGGCRDREITAYRAPKDPVETPPGPPAGAATAPGAGDMANTAVPTGGDSLVWTARAQWTAKPASAMRKGSYTVKGDGGEADLSITAFPGDTGGLLANINRWRGQVSLPPLNPEQLDANREHVDLGALHVDVVDFAGSANGTPTRIVGAIVPTGGETWFFKLMGPDALVAKEKPAFREFLQTVRPR
jgi:hypothetical protein